MGLLAVKHLDPVVGVDVHSVLVTPGTPPVFLPHPHVGFMLDLREYIQAAKAVVGCIAMMIVQEKVTEYIEDHPEDVTKLEHLADEASQQVNELIGGGKLPDLMDDPTVAEGMKLAKEANKLKNRISDDLGSNVGSGGSSGRPIFVNGMMRATAGTHAYHVPGLHFPLGESFAPPPEEVEPSNDGESFMGSKTVLANNDPMSYMALEALSCWSIGMEPPPHNSAHTDRTYPSMPSSVMLPIPAGRPVFVGGPPIVNMAALAVGLFKAFRGSAWAKNLADKLHLKPGFLRCNILGADPVDMITGEVVVQQHDFTVSGRLPLVWKRHYASHVSRCGAVGVGWQTLADVRLELLQYEGAVGVVAHFVDHATAFDTMPNMIGWPGRTYDWQSGYALYLHGDGLVVRTRSGIEYEFELPAHWQRILGTQATERSLTLPVMRMADPNGNAWTFCRGQGQSLTRIVEWKGEQTTGRMIECGVTHGRQTGAPAGLLTAVTLVDANNRAHSLVSYEHDRNGNLIEVFDAMGHPHHFVYSDGHRMVRHTSVHGMSFYYSHQQHEDGAWRVDHAWGDNGLLDYRFVFDLEHNETRITDSLGHMSVLQSNARGLPVARIDALGGVTSYRYDARDRASALTDPAGHTTQWEYDAYGNLLAQTLPDGSVVRSEYDSACKPVVVTYPGGGTARYVWDERGNLLERSTPAQSRIRYEYDQHGQFVAQTDPVGAVTRLSYDNDGNIAEIIDALGHCMGYTHDARGNLIRTVDATGSASRYEYDQNGNMTRAIAPDGRETFYRYDANDNLTHYCDPAGQATQLGYSALGQIIRRSTPEGGVVEYRYDSEARLISVINERGEIYQLKRNALGQVVEEVDYWGQTCRYEYGASGEVLRTIDALGRAIDYQRDALGRVVQKRVQDRRQPDGIRTETFLYDRAGNLVAAENPDSRIEFTHDLAGRIIAERYGEGFEILHQYDADGDRVKRTTRLEEAGAIIERTTRYEFDVLKRVTLMSASGVPPIRFEHDALGRIRVERFGESLRREASYTAEGSLERQTLLRDSRPFFASEYAYDVNGELIEKHRSGANADYFQYDAIGTLAEHLNSAGRCFRFTVDQAGDLMTTRVREGAARRDAFGNTLPGGAWFREGEYGGAYHLFDRVGNLVRKHDSECDMELCWDGDGQLIESRVSRPQWTERGQCGGTLLVLTQYSYDALHRRTRKVTRLTLGAGGAGEPCEGEGAPSCITRFFWDGDVLIATLTQSDRQFELLMSRAKSDFALSDLVTDANDSRRAVPVTPGEYQEWVCYPDTSRPLAWLREAVPPAGTELARAVSADVCDVPALLPQPAPRIDWLSTDLNGMPIRGDNIESGISWSVAYSPWGAIDRTTSTPGVDQPLRFLGQYEDRETSLYYNRYRYYDPSAAQYISIDPIRLDGGDNLYRYARNPIAWTDPLGLSRARITRFRYFGHPDPAIEAQVRAKIAQLLQQRPDLVESGKENIGIALLDDGTITDPVVGNQTEGHPEAKLLRAYPDRIKCLWSEREPCDQRRYFGQANTTMHMNDTPCQTLIHGSQGIEQVYYYIMTGSREAADWSKVLRKHAAEGVFLPQPKRSW
ncbi:MULTISPECIES: RHS repeat-associated core domain-containing protein [Burkholderia]|uniref:RhsD protein n=1 Tax=Burkholderia aenigmatica TaxID=2015348 RepID=A0ABY6XZF3_9BURK|nr:MULTISPECIES: RHS repeat-associated core domain-containing protein [Burkholderia]VWC64563.1 rhsD protein [Burkholderia aenigmatica]VWC86200.1 rhsD protein [Burkholderia aenigmatica]